MFHVHEQVPITWSLHLPYKPVESTLSDEKLFIEIAFAEYFSRLLSNIQSEQSYDHTSHTYFPYIRASYVPPRDFAQQAKSLRGQQIVKANVA